jgi:hypothetical protein
MLFVSLAEAALSLEFKRRPICSFAEALAIIFRLISVSSWISADDTFLEGTKQTPRP